LLQLLHHAAAAAAVINYFTTTTDVIYTFGFCLASLLFTSC